MLKLFVYEFGLLAGFMSILLFYLVLQGKRDYYALAIFFLTASWAMFEYALWAVGTDMFGLILAPVFPLDFFFAVWIGFVVWLGEQIGKRKIWICWIVFLFCVFVISRFCMDCVHF